MSKSKSKKSTFFLGMFNISYFSSYCIGCLSSNVSIKREI